MKVLITHSYFLRYDTKQWSIGKPYPPLGTLYATSSLIEAGHEVSFSDSMFFESPEQINRSLDDLPDLFIIYDDGFNYLTKMCLTNMRQAAFSMIHLARKKGAKVIVSSSDATDHYKQYLEEGADYVLIGEGEKTLIELVNLLQHNLQEQSLQNSIGGANPQQQARHLVGSSKVTAMDNRSSELDQIAGLAFKMDEEVKRTETRPVLRDLDRLPLPAWSMLDIEPYKNRWLKNAGYFSVNVGTTRGCPYKCNWCAKPIYGNRYNSRSPGNVIAELTVLKELFGFDHVWFCDDIFGLKPGWVEEFADLIISRGLKFRFKIQSRADLLVNEAYVQALARAGCEEVWMGAESGSQQILNAMDKGIQVHQIELATALLKKHQIKPCFFIQFGYRGETKDDIQLTIKMINRLLPHEIGISVSYPLPGTVFYETVKAELKEKSNWTDSDEMALMFKNTYSPGYYKQLHSYVHKNYRKHLAIQSFRNLLKRPLSITTASMRKAISWLYFFPAVMMAGFQLKKLEGK